jgi:hypothetical protein
MAIAAAATNAWKIFMALVAVAWESTQPSLFEITHLAKNQEGNGTQEANGTRQAERAAATAGDDASKGEAHRPLSYRPHDHAR